jgi:hypothetical protein
MFGIIRPHYLGLLFRNLYKINWKRDMKISGIIYYPKIMIILGGEIS